MSLPLNPTTCYDAVTRDDPKFDGVFYTAVLTTGIYCRPICRAQTPRRENVRFFATAAAAAEAGFRPCLKCRPELAPDPPQNQRFSPVIERALRLIGRGALDDAGVDDLARRLKLSQRQLRRIFLDEIGAPPVAVAQTRRLLFAKKLIDETYLSMADIAFSAGFGSVRRFNDTIRKTYGRTPSEIRKLRNGSMPDASGTDISLKLAYREPYNWPAMFAMLRAQAIPRVEFVGADVYRRTVRVDGVAGSVVVKPIPAEPAVSVRVSPELRRRLLSITEMIKDIFDLRADPLEIAGHLASDPELATHVWDRAGVRLPGTWSGFELAVRAILDTHPSRQGDYLAAALIDGYGEEWPESGDPTLSHFFPHPERLVCAGLSGIGLTQSQAEALHHVADAAARGQLAFDGELPAEVLLKRLLAVPGLDEGAAHLIVMRSLGEADLFHSSLAAVSEESLRRSEDWRPWRSYAAMYLRAATMDLAATEEPMPDLSPA